jgi:hypothetical protein
MTARSALSLVFATLLASAGSTAFAQAPEKTTTGGTTGPAATSTVPDLPAPHAAATAAEARDANGAPLVDAPQPAPRTKEAKVEHLVTEDSKVRIEETRVRGVTTKIVVHSKIPGVGSYEIQPKDPGLDPENDHGAGMRLFSFGF